MTFEEAADRLYGVPIAEFTAERARLAKELSGDDAKALSALRKPTAAAGILNQLTRRHRRDVDLLLDAGHRLREAQAGVLQGAERETFQRARAQEVDALRRLVREAQSLGASGGALQQVEQSLRAAAVSEEGRELLARGRFVKPIEASSGFDVVAGLAGDAPRRRPAAPSQADDRRRSQEELRAAREALRAAEAEARAATHEAERLRGELGRAESTAEDAEARVAAARRAVDEAKKKL